MVEIWDIGGEALQYPALLKHYLYASNAILYCYDITNYASLNQLDNWDKWIMKAKLSLTKRVLVGNKSDLSSIRTSKPEDHQKFMQDYGMDLPLTLSARTRENLLAGLNQVVALCLGLSLKKYEFENVNVMKARVSKKVEEPVVVESKAESKCVLQ